MPGPKNAAGLTGGWHGPRDRREGHRQRKIRRLLIAANGQPVSARDMIAIVYPGRTSWPEWCWACVRRSAERYAERVWPRARPLRWKARTDMVSAHKQTESET
jgi:hypothetical protein